MYTQCPECQTAFRITATVLKQAAGRVRCGGCGKAFNAIEHLSEEPPRISQAPEPPLREQAPASQEVLEKLDQLTGPDDVRIEDTGIEWRVLGDEDATDEGEPGGEDAATRWFVDTPAGAGPRSLPVAIEEIDVATTGDTAAHRMIDTQTALDLEGDEIPGDELRFDDNTPLPEDYDELDHGADQEEPVPRRRAEDAEEPAPPEFMEAQHDLELSDPEEWEGLLSEMGVNDYPGTRVEIPEISAVDDVTVIAGDDEEPGPPIGEEDELEPADEVDADTGEEDGLSLEVEEELAAIHSELSFRPSARNALGDTQLVAGTDEDDESETLLEADDQGFDFEALLDEDDTQDEEKDESLSISESDPGSGIEFDESTGEFREKIAAAEHALHERDFRSGAAADGARDKPATEDDEEEREKTVNLQIDEELLRAMEDEDFAATMTLEDGSPLVETIIMEGEFISASLDAERRAADSSARHHVPEGASLADTYMLNREKEKSRFRISWPGKGIAAGILLLLLLLAGQYVHNSREWLATYGTFNQTLGPVYRTLGSPVRPKWDIRGWRFETTAGGTDETGSTLTIQSRIANRSQTPLPYPLVHVSLTDRWEETIGSRVLEPNEYLAGNADPRRPLAPGERFTAVITIESPSPDATGFKLNVCYRESPGVVRCAIEDFKD